ncbi:class I SAM-dependent methyltransferase [Dokdonella sp.]|uniref:class I SAM-dependent methyltransferase n=1 Tax=Dokdonella sp. TaxID=2291710 RepID=UPI0037834BE6
MNPTHPAHWDAVYREKDEAQTSWYRPHLVESLRLIDLRKLKQDAPVIDIGGGRSTLVDDLLARGFNDVSVLDLSDVALAQARQRLGENAERVQWIVGDVTDVRLPAAHYGLWHDRAAFHFLTEAQQRSRYVAAAARAVRPGGLALIATFAPDGPERCSDLPVCRYDAMMLEATFAPAFELAEKTRHVHVTPDGRPQPFVHVVLRRRANA